MVNYILPLTLKSIKASPTDSAWPKSLHKCKQCDFNGGCQTKDKDSKTTLNYKTSITYDNTSGNALN